MLGREVIKGEELFFVFFQALSRFWILGLVAGNERIISAEAAFLLADRCILYPGAKSGAVAGGASDRGQLGIDCLPMT